MRIICWFIGHNKMLEVRHEVGYIEYYDVCTQCHKSWLNKQLSDLPIISKPKIVKKSMKVIAKPILQKIAQKPIQIKKAMVNFYVI